MKPEIRDINHVTLIVDNLEEAASFYEKEFGLSPLPAYNFDYPVMFYRLNETQQLHLSEWEDKPSFRGHVCFKINQWNETFWRFRELGVIDITPWGKVRQLPDGPMQMFVRDPSGNLLELSSLPDYKVDPKILETEEFQAGLYKSDRGEEGARGFKSDDATLYHGLKEK